MMTNYILSGVITLVIWGIGAAYIKWWGSDDTMDYLAWLKIWVITGGFIAFGISMLLGIVFPDPAMEEMLKSTPDILKTVPDLSTITPSLPK